MKKSLLIIKGLWSLIAAVWVLSMAVAVLLVGFIVFPPITEYCGQQYSALPQETSSYAFLFWSALPAYSLFSILILSGIIARKSYLIFARGITPKEVKK